MPLDYKYWHEHLKGHPDNNLVGFILNGIKYGVHIGHTGPIHSIVSKNWPSAHQFNSHIKEAITKNVNKGRVTGAFDHPPLNNFVSSPLGCLCEK